METLGDLARFVRTVIGLGWWLAPGVLFVAVLVVGASLKAERGGDGDDS